ncbi:MFS transporter [Geodermatophilus dictyosporus]|uniref:MFS transporter n=1 Tax=Geodermatophilus dictyosporus TaxID=1523247 RepID=UPI000AF9D635|nr:MFS transporter [Geodermatophilus dictyosporus]
MPGSARVSSRASRGWTRDWWTARRFAACTQVTPSPLWARLSDRIGRRPVFALGALGSAALAFPFLRALQQGDGPLVVVSGIALFGVVYSAANGIRPSFYGEMSSTQVRYSGMAIGTQIGFALGGFSPVIATAIVGEGSGGWVPVALLTAGALPSPGSAR